MTLRLQINFEVYMFRTLRSMDRQHAENLTSGLDLTNTDSREFQTSESFMGKWEKLAE